MAKKKDDLPAMPFYTGDWFKAGDVRSLTVEQRGIWIDMLFYMWESNERGVLVDASGKPYTTEELSRMIGLPEDLLKQNLKQMESKKIFSLRDLDGAIYCRRMMKDAEIRKIRKEIGKIGGNRNKEKNLLKQNDKQNTKQNTENEIENEIEIYNNKEGVTGGEEESLDALKKAYKEDPKLLFVRYWRRNAGPEEVRIAAELIEKFGIEKLTYAFHESMEHAAFSIAYVKKILLNVKGKEDAQMVEQLSASNRKNETEESAALIKKQKDDHKKWIADLWSRYKNLNGKTSQATKEKILKHLQNQMYVNAEQILFDLEDKETNSVEVDGFTSIGKSLETIIN